MTGSTPKVVRKHDFGRTDLLERVDVQALHGLLETFARAATQKLTSTLRQPCTFEIDGLDQLMWRDLVLGLEGSQYFFTFALPPLAGRAVFIMPTDEMLALVDVRLAGTGEDDFTGRVPSDIDRAFLESIMEDLLAELGRTVNRLQTTTPVLEDQESNVQFVAVGSVTEMFLVARLNFSLASRAPREGLLCLPFTLVRLLIDGLQTRSGLAGESRERVLAAENRRRIHEVPLDLVFQFPSFVTTPAELLTLQVGEYLGLGHAKGRPLEVRVAGIQVAWANICSSGVRKACEITEEVTK